jgi:hypothetical protein
MGAIWDIRYNQFVQLGRTSNDPIDDAATAHPTVNQKGRYAEHHHHAGSSVGSADVGNTYLGNPATTKWGLAIHGTSDVLVESNVVVDFPGAGMVTEDGYEVRNVFRKNFVAYIQSTPPALDSRQNILINRPGSDGSGYWFRGVMNYFEGNEAWNNFGSGINLFNQSHLMGLYSRNVGGAPDTSVNKFTAQPLSFIDNIAAANVLTGLELWAVRRFPYRTLVVANTLMFGIFAHSSDGIGVELQTPTIVCEVGKGISGRGTVGIHSADGYVGTFHMTGGQIAGCTTGITGGGSANEGRVGVGRAGMSPKCFSTSRSASSTSR